MKTNKTCMAASSVLLILSACGKTGADPVPVGAETIRFAGPLQTRATVNADERSVFQVRDWYDNTRHYIENTLQYTDPSWDYGTPPAAPGYIWTQGSHLFFGWLQQNNVYTTPNFFGAGGVTLDGTTLTIPPTTLNTGTRQYDFLYSDAVRRSSGGSDPVQLVFRHLFAKVSVSFQVTGETDVIALQKVYLAGADEADPENGLYVQDATPFKNRMGVEIEFGGADGVTVSYDVENAEADGYFADPVSFDDAESFPLCVSMDKNSIPIDVLSQTQSYDAVSYLMWPRTWSDSEKVIIVKYQVGGVEHTACMSFPKGTVWEAGHEYHYRVTYMGGYIQIQESILPWEAEDPVSVGGEAAEQPLMASWLGWDSQSCTVSGKDRTVATFLDEPDLGDADRDGNREELKPVLGRFRIYSPVECEWQVALKGEGSGSFSISPSGGTVSETEGEGSTLPGANIEFFISALEPAGSDVTVGLTFTVTYNGRTYSLDSEIQKDGDFQIILPATQTSGD